MIWVSSQWYVGDDANQNVKLADYWIANLHASYQYTKQVQFYGSINNVFNRHYATFGTYFDPDGVQFAMPNPPTDPRTVTPGAAALGLCRHAREVVNPSPRSPLARHHVGP